jgi:gamma-glutamylcyclotransferase (GGCT)/AIG2-like uncharacterized protein YtfP
VVRRQPHSGVWWESADKGGALEGALALINAVERATWPTEAARAAALIDALLDFPSTRLAAYGTLMPGQSNHALLATVGGTWVEGTVPGVRFMANGYPAFNWRPGDPRVPVSVLTSAALPEHWARLDDFEGVAYRRILVPVRLPNDTMLVANLYEHIGSVGRHDVREADVPR